MSDLIDQQPSFFDEAVTEYKTKQKEVLKGFVYGCIELWEILLKFRTQLKLDGTRMKFLEACGLNLSQSSQQIRLFEYSQKKLEKEVLSTVITNREKLNLFLALPEEQKEKLLQKGLDEKTTTEDFREAVVSIKGEDTPVIPDDDTTEDEMWKKIEEQTGWNPLLVDTKKASKTVQEELGMGLAARAYLEWILYIEKTKEIIREDNGKLSADEKEKLKLLYAKQLSELQDALDKFFS